ncbi:MAG: hypothetical protein KJ600_01925 [Nanoarchaeota archaeon]|nr:hypothetical protein [Nanoarchaeota archaeon]MBU1103294.1 hypothetical protein [Nanoarchaeota archaeon]
MGPRNIHEFNEPGRQAELERLYGPTVSSWDDVECWDDVVIKEEKAVVSHIEAERAGCDKCPYLGRKGDYFRFCGVRADRMASDAAPMRDGLPRFQSPEYNAKVSHMELQLFCLQDQDRFIKCLDFQAACARKFGAG